MDGSLSTDEENDPLQFTWLTNGVFFASGKVATNCPQGRLLHPDAGGFGSSGWLGKLPHCLVRCHHGGPKLWPSLTQFGQ